ncbi:hypothetical protein [Streptomyces sp. NPDC056132]|uniref:hypothetical protein n=1 Tax=Streptomyces sp. NPDC056132 TaxID=3345722 RepID=UPI0035D6B2A2
MNDQLQKFIATYLQLEQAYDTSGHLRPTLLAFNADFVEKVQAGLGELLREKTLTVAEYERLTHIEFSDSDVLYEYLQGVYAYLFEGGSEQPTPPE